ncbi:DUF3781 domain-containing protein [Pediococcus pentosaceus]|uniref:DUF3781 domain-containing protein n=1 Tax=Pediococcus pentosaceus TaxID=1255 RepID=UPI0011B68825|nr:DUF3781 domain-containing protein [Pediococcus pentosaceus]QDZ69746.1 DUF3781 domain-containing protein [Pediococcus pentosaceus]
MSKSNPSTINSILPNLCYTPLVYERINKKLANNLTQSKIEKLIYEAVKNADSIEKRGKNYYVNNLFKHISITINSHNFRVITVNKL